VQGLALLSSATSPEEKVKLAFLLCDLEASGGVTLANLLRVLSFARPAGADADAGGPVEGGSASANGDVTPPFLQRSASTMERDFLAHDVNGDQELDFGEFVAFLAANPEVLNSTTGVMTSRLKAADLLQPLSETVDRIKHARKEAGGKSDGRKAQHDAKKFAAQGGLAATLL